ncbi:hypothetical protein SAMD00079811_28270 [Scytonema sp. HK-05]|uniref:hypothetical protein n=1 Tax=Scytonema sp. HK-05 TaxID=1137095 RepID=UPI000937C9D7|nr:hypothetical protein [Scytonema sp. HK-05]OKH49388.1 hypothetical protein NIES2130_34815 [Scytonema sp. HK-05]BAY45225.1 hypothetical protein SAMD00079811_28270 [Scytonema sp. HK-05]
MPIETVPGTSLQYYLVAFDATGNERDEPEGKMSQKILDILSTGTITDVFIFSHGWLGDIPAARFQYNNWVGAMSKNVADIEQIKQARSGFRPLLIGLHWPSLPWGDEELGSGSVSFAPTETDPIEQLVEQYAQRIANTEAARQALRIIFSAAMDDIAPATLPPEVREAYEVLNQEAGLGSEGEGAAPGADREAFDPESIFQVAELEPINYGDSDWGALLMPLQALSFWKMKDRACKFGESGGFQLLTKLQQATADSVRFHLMGHSFGCIVVSAILAGDGHSTLARPVNSVVLVQGALSFWSYCSDIPVAPGRAGYFHSIVADRKVSGPLVTTQSELDTAVGKMYPHGARVSQQIAYGLNEFPKFGGLGTFGARGPGLEIVDMQMLPLDASYKFEAGKIYNLESTKYICDNPDGGWGGAHSDIAKPEVAHAVWQAALSS